jgi:hypothetical protein
MVWNVCVSGIPNLLAIAAPRQERAGKPSEGVARLTMACAQHLWDGRSARTRG